MAVPESSAQLIDLAMAAGNAQEWRDPAGYWPRLSAATVPLDPPYAVLDASALAFNVHDLLRRAGGRRIRIASKSLRSRAVLASVLAVDGFAGVLAYTLPEALWLAQGGKGYPGFGDVVVGYPTVDRAAIATLAGSPELAGRVTLMVDSVEHLDLIDRVVSPRAREAIRLCLDLDASWRIPGLGPAGHIGVRRSPVHTPAQIRDLAAAIVDRPGFRLVGVMSYEAQIAGVGDDVPGHPLRSRLIRWMQHRSKNELLDRRRSAIAAVRQVSELEFVNGGGTGSLEFTAADPAITEIAAGSGLFGPHLFDSYQGFHPAPAAAFALSVVRTPAPGIAALLGGGWIASGPPGPDRLPVPVWPEGLHLIPTEMAGEVQTPLSGAAGLRVGDRVWLRHAKAGELSEHVNVLNVIRDGQVATVAPTYRGEGKAFL